MSRSDMHLDAMLRHLGSRITTRCMAVEERDRPDGLRPGVASAARLRPTHVPRPPSASG
jgi:hypothetical protein